MRALGVLSAFAAASLFNLGLAVQTLDAREAPTHLHLRVSLLRRLLGRARWVGGTLLTVAGWPFQVLAFALAPVELVQPSLALGLLVVLAAGKRMLHEPIARRDVLAVLAIVAGVAGIAAVAPADTSATPPGLTLGATLGVLAVLSLLPYALIPFGRPLPEISMLGAGVAYASSAITSALVERAFASGALLVVFGWGMATLALDSGGLLSEMSALGRRPAVQVAPAILVVQTIVPVGLAPLLFGETPAGAGNVAGLAVSLLVLIAGSVALIRSPALLAVVAADRAPERAAPEGEDQPGRPRGAGGSSSRRARSQAVGGPLRRPAAAVEALPDDDQATGAGA